MRKLQPIWLIALLLCWSGCDCCLPLAVQNLAAQTRSLNISGPSEVVLGQLVRLEAEIDPAESPFWIVLKPADLDYEQVENGKRLIFAVGCDQEADLTVMLLAQREVDERIVTRQLIRRIAVRPSDEVPSPDPVLPPPGDPVPPDSPLIELPIYQAVLTAWNSIPSSDAKAKSREVADNFAETARQCAALEFDSIPQIWKSLAAKNAQTLGPHTRDWEVVGRALQSEFKKLALGSVKEHAVHLEAAALAIKTGHQDE